MSAVAPTDWRNDFGLANRKPPQFFSSVNQLDNVEAKVPQAHALRRAFEHDKLRVDGVLCQDNTPIIYFRQVSHIKSKEVLELHRLFWNQGVAPILILIAQNEVHIYSGLVPPSASPADTGEGAGFVETLSRVGDHLQSFLLSVE